MNTSGRILPAFLDQGNFYSTSDHMKMTLSTGMLMKNIMYIGIEIAPLVEPYLSVHI